jgi:3-methyladenine DNA glycosylase AlkD
MNDDSYQIVESLRAIGDAEKSSWLENYVKHDIVSLGVGIPDIREVVRRQEKAGQLTRQPLQVQMQVLDALMEQVYTEAKLAAILYMQLYWKADTVDEMLHLLSRWFDNEWIADWNVCDWLCVRLLSPLVDVEPEPTIAALAQWNGSPNLWKARASLVPFAQCKTLDKHSDTVLRFSEVLIHRDERFCKTAVGWVLRQYSRIDHQFVVEFLERNREYITPEVVKNATKYLKR